MLELISWAGMATSILLTSISVITPWFWGK